jgi:hypothetical protein
VGGPPWQPASLFHPAQQGFFFKPESQSWHSSAIERRESASDGIWLAASFMYLCAYRRDPGMPPQNQTLARQNLAAWAAQESTCACCLEPPYLPSLSRPPDLCKGRAMAPLIFSLTQARSRPTYQSRRLDKMITSHGRSSSFSSYPSPLL